MSLLSVWCFEFLIPVRKSAKKYEKDLLGEYHRRDRPADGLSIPQVALMVKAFETGQDSFEVHFDEEEKMWFLSNGEEEIEMPEMQTTAEYFVAIEPDSARCILRQRGPKRKKQEVIYADTKLRPLISGEELNRQYIKSRAIFQSLLPPNYDELKLVNLGSVDEDSLDEAKDERASGKEAVEGLARLHQQARKAKAIENEEKCDCGLPNKVCAVCGMGYGQRVKPAGQSVPPSEKLAPSEKPLQKPEQKPDLQLPDSDSDECEADTEMSLGESCQHTDLLRFDPGYCQSSAALLRTTASCARRARASLHWCMCQVVLRRLCPRPMSTAAVEIGRWAWTNRTAEWPADAQISWLSWLG